MSDGLLSRVAGGDAAATQACVQRYSGIVWSLARRLLANPADAEEATQEIFVEIWKHAGRHDPAKGSEKLFVMMIARRRLIDRIRRQARQPRHESLDDPDTNRVLVSAETTAETAVDLDLARRVLETLPDEQQKIIAMCIVDGMTHREVAEATGKPLGTVKTMVRRGLIRVREALRKLDAGSDDGTVGEGAQ